MADKWYYMVDRNKIGPVSRDQILILLRRRVLKAHTPVWNATMPRYVPVEDLDELAPFIPDNEAELVTASVTPEQPPVKGFTKFLVPRKKREAVGAPARRTRAPYASPKQLDDEAPAPESKESAPLPANPPSPPSPAVAEDEDHKSAAKHMSGAVSEGMRLLGAASLSIGAAIFGVFVLGLIDLLVGAQRDLFYDGISWLIPREFLTLLDPVEWLGVLIVGGLVGSAASAGCGGRGNVTVAGIAALCAFLSVTIGAIFAELLAVSLDTGEPLGTLVFMPEAWIDGVQALLHGLWEEPDDLLFLFGAAGEAFLISRHNYRRSEDEAATRVVDPFLRT